MMKKIPALLLSTAFLCTLPAAAQSATQVITKQEKAESYVRQLRKTLFTAGEKADVAAAEKLADKLVELHISGVSRRMLVTVYACAAAGTPVPVRENERIAMEKNFHNTTTYAPNKNMEYAMAFANGWGVKTDLERATAYACHANTDPLELIIQTEALDMMTDWQASGTFADKNKVEPFTFCSFAQTPSHVGRCDVHKVALEQYENETSLEDAAKKAGFSKTQLKALNKLEHAAAMFFQEQIWKEYLRGGADAGTRFAHFVSASNRAFDQDLADFLHGSLLAHISGVPDVAQVDRDWDARLKNLYAHKNDPTYFPGTRTAEMLHDTQFFWQEYHDAWLALYQARYPKKDISALSAWLKYQRLQQIERLYGHGQ